MTKYILVQGFKAIAFTETDDTLEDVINKWDKTVMKICRIPLVGVEYFKDLIGVWYVQEGGEIFYCAAENGVGNLESIGMNVIEFPEHLPEAYDYANDSEKRRLNRTQKTLKAFHTVKRMTHKEIEIRLGCRVEIIS